MCDRDFVVGLWVEGLSVYDLGLRVQHSVFWFKVQGNQGGMWRTFDLHSKPSQTLTPRPRPCATAL